MRRIAASLFALLFGLQTLLQVGLQTAAVASQATLVTPGAPLPMSGLATFLNAALLSLGSCNSGNSAPVNGTGAAAFAGECWINTTSNPWVFSYTDDGTHWAQFGSLNTTTHVFTVPLGSGGTGQTSAAAARASAALNVDGYTGHGDSIYTILASDRVVGTTAAFTASRTWTLPAASALNPGQSLLVSDFAGAITATNTLVIARAGSDTINGATSATINATNGAFLLVSDGVSKWTAQAIGAASVAGAATLAGNNTFTGNDYFRSGSPWCDVKAEGAAGNGSTDDTAAINACITLLAAIGNGPTSGGKLFFPPGIYCSFTGLSTINVSMEIVGASVDGSAISSCGHDVTLLTINFSRVHVHDINIWGNGFNGYSGGTGPGSVNPAVNVLSGGVGAKLENMQIIGGTGILCQAQDVVLRQIDAAFSYGAAVIQEIGCNGFIDRNKLDFSWPVQTPPTTTLTINPWAATTTYAAGAVVTVSQGGATYYLQEALRISGASINAGGTGGTPGACTVTMVGGTLATYGQPTQISGTVSGGGVLTSLSSVTVVGTYLTLPSNPVAVTGCGLSGASLTITAPSQQSGGSQPTVPNYVTPVIDGGATWFLVAPSQIDVLVDSSSGETKMFQNDMTAPTFACVAVENNHGGAAPQLVVLRDSICSDQIRYNVFAGVGADILIDGNELLGCVQTCQNVELFSTWTSGATISHNWLGAAGIGIDINTSHVIVDGNYAVGSLGTGIATAGTNDWMQIGLNDVSLATTGCSKGATGAHITFTANWPASC